MEKYNLEKLVKIECNDFAKSKWYKYKKNRKFFGIVTQKEGIYFDIFDIYELSDTYLGMEVPKNHTLKNGVVYENPEVILHYQADITKVYYFNSLDEAKKFTDEITAIGRWQ